jgi:NAD-dependent dihydropyrimidine dehydrogenase PreA subunit
VRRSSGFPSWSQIDAWGAECATSCGRQVYAFDYEANVAVVEHPMQCMVGCTTCATVCTRDAIEFPSQGYIRQVIRKHKLERQTKDVLKANREQYDIRRRDQTSNE